MSDTPIVELKPCPFCWKRSGQIRGHRRYRWVVCRSFDCRAEGPPSSNNVGAITAWNTRITPPAPVDVERDDERRMCLATQNDLGNEQARVLALENELATFRARVEEMRDALEQTEACMSIVEPRSDAAEYRRILGVIRAALSPATEGAPTPSGTAPSPRPDGEPAR